MPDRTSSAGSIEDAASVWASCTPRIVFWQMELLRRRPGRRRNLPARLLARIVNTDRTCAGSASIAPRRTASARCRRHARHAGSLRRRRERLVGDKERQYGLELTMIKLCRAGAITRNPAARPIRWCGQADGARLDGNWRAELLRLRLLRKVGEDHLKFLIDRSERESATPPCRSAHQVLTASISTALSRHRQCGDR